MNRFVLHIGALEAGTHLLQDYLGDHIVELREHDISVIDERDMDHYVLQGQQLIERPELLLARLDDEFRARPGVTVVGSQDGMLGTPLSAHHRGWYPFAEPRIEALGRIAEEFDTIVVLYVRSQADVIESSYLQTVRKGDRERFDEWFARIDTSRLSWSPLIDALRSALGDERLVVGDVSEFADGHNRFVERFLRRARPSFSGHVDFTPLTRRRLSDLGLQLALTANRHLRSDDERSQMFDFLLEEYSDLDAPPPTLLSADERARLDERYESEFDDL